MAVKDVIESLRRLKRHDRVVDREIALLIGYKRSMDPIKGVMWRYPGSDTIGIPFYTKSLDAAKSLCDRVAPGNAGGYSWEVGSGSAQIEGAEIVTAANPAIALCIAALMIVEKNDDEAF